MYNPFSQVCGPEAFVRTRNMVHWGDRAFAVAAQRLWNELHSSSITEFKTHLKTHFYPLAEVVTYLVFVLVFLLCLYGFLLYYFILLISLRYRLYILIKLYYIISYICFFHSLACVLCLLVLYSTLVSIVLKVLYEKNWFGLDYITKQREKYMVVKGMTSV